MNTVAIIIMAAGWMVHVWWLSSQLDVERATSKALRDQVAKLKHMVESAFFEGEHKSHSYERRTKGCEALYAGSDARAALDEMEKEHG